ncbi:MAG: 1,4-dihydroxy-6-naphthoate synthase [Chitinophagales bacterium]
MRTLSLGFSPCPNDTFIFDALVNDKIDTEGIDFNFHIADVAELNKMAFEGALDITKLSYHALGYVLDKYELLHAGSALGNNCGPLLIAKEEIDLGKVTDLKIAIPGKFTTANFLLSLAFPTAMNKEEMLFSEIEDAVLKGRVDAGLIIHENRFTYQEKGLKKLIDLGEYWETETELPIPLGGIVIRRSLPVAIKSKINNLVKKSVENAMKNPNDTLPYVSQYAQEMNHKVMMQHIDLYVNEYSLNLGEKGQKAIIQLFQTAQTKNIIPQINHSIFVQV